MNISSVLQSELSQFLGPHQLLVDESSRGFYGRDWIKDFVPAPTAVILPESTEQVRKIVVACRKAKIGIVPSGGRTGLSGGATAAYGEIVLSMERMRKIVSVNSTDRTLRCFAGATLAKVQETALEHELFFPVDFSSRGSCQIGGNIATNAGGIKVIRYGNIRDWVLGLTVVTGSGEILNLNGSLFKNNTGLDLKNLFVGSEGILGIITECTVRLTSKPGPLCRAMCAVASMDGVLPFLTYCRQKLRELSAFELIESEPFNEVISKRGLRNPFDQSYPVYLLVECEENSPAVRNLFQAALGEALEQGLASDAVLAESTAQSEELMNIRDLISETLSTHYTIHKNDISVPVPEIPSFITELKGALSAIYPSHKVMIFGHVGDGNLHVNILKVGDLSDSEFWLQCKEADQRIFALVQKFHGSISAEHGLGMLKRDFLGFTRSESEISLMREIKAAFDPDGIMNPGKVLPDLTIAG
jgi:FAD/FMN-containing dehydrogenase